MPARRKYIAGDCDASAGQSKLALQSKGAGFPRTAACDLDEMIIATPKFELARNCILHHGSAKQTIAVHVDSAGVQASGSHSLVRAFAPACSGGVSLINISPVWRHSVDGPIRLERRPSSQVETFRSARGQTKRFALAAVRGGMEKNAFVIEPSRSFG